MNRYWTIELGCGDIIKRSLKHRRTWRKQFRRNKRFMCPAHGEQYAICIFGDDKWYNVIREFMVT